MAKLSDLFLNTLGGFIGGSTGYTQQQEESQRKQKALDIQQQEANNQRLTALAHLGSVYNIASTNPPSPSTTGLSSETSPSTGSTSIPVPGMSGYTMTPQSIYDVVPQYDQSGKFTGQYTHIERPRGGKTTAFKPPSGNTSVANKTFIGNDADGNPIFADKSGQMTLGEVPGGGPVLPKTSTQPTSQTRASGEFADTIIPHIQDLRDLIKKADAKGFIGPAAGRVYGQFLSGTIGSTDNDEADKILGQLRATDSLLKTGAMKVHFGSRGGSDMYDHFSDMLNSGKQSSATLNGSLNGIESFMQGYSNAAKPKRGGRKLLGDNPTSAPASERDRFIQGAIQKGYSQMEAEGLASQNGLQ